MPGDDLKQHVNSEEDFYAVLGIGSIASEAEIRRAYRQTARVYHPDKVGAHDTAALEKFHKLQIAYDVLSDATVKELYDNVRKARELRKAQYAAHDERRRAMIERLEEGEKQGRNLKRGAEDQESALEQKIARLAEESRQRIRRQQEQRDREWAMAQERDQTAETLATDKGDRRVLVRCKIGVDTRQLDEASLTALFKRFGPVDVAVFKQKRLKPPGEKHKVDYWSGIVDFKSSNAAQAAIDRFPALHERDADFKLVESVTWSKEDGSSSKAPQTVRSMTSLPTPASQSRNEINASDQHDKHPKFSFNIAKHAPQIAGKTSFLDEDLMSRLKEAERHRLEMKRQQATVNDLKE